MTFPSYLDGWFPTCATTVALALLAGCGGTHSSPGTYSTATSDPLPASPTAATQSDAAPLTGRLLVFFKRSQGVDPMASQLTVDVDGASQAVVTEGGVDGARVQTFKLTPLELRTLRGLVHRTHLDNTCCCNDAYYVYWVSTPAGSFRLQQGHVPAALRPLMKRLNSITDKHTNK